MYRLHIANKNYSSWSLRPWVLMRELGIGFNEHVHPFGEGSNWAGFRMFAPNGKVPCLQDEETTVWDSLAIIEYLAERHAGVWPVDTRARAWARSAAAEMHSGFATLRNRCPMSCGIRVKLGEIPEPLRDDIARVDELWTEGLSRFGGPYLAGPRFTAVDACFAPVAFRWQSYGLPLSARAAEYAGRLLALPSMRQWYEAALAETWREPGHESDICSAGEVLEDLRTAAGDG